MNAKRGAIILTVIAVSTFAWAVARPWLDSPVRFSSLAVIIWPSVAFVLLAAVVGMAWVLLDKPLDRLIAILGSWGTFVVFWPANIWYVSLLPLFVFLWYEAGRRIRDDLATRHTLKMNIVLNGGVKWILLGAFAMVSLGFYLLPSSQALTLKSISSGIQSSVKSAYDNPVVMQQLSQLPPASQQEFKSSVAKNIDATVHQWFGGLAPYVPPLLAFALFLTLWSVAFIFRELAIWLGVLIFAILKITGFIRLEEESVKAEVLKM